MKATRFFLILLLCLPSLSSFGAPVGFSFKDTAGKLHKLSDYKGRWVLVNFWATWCPPCLEEIPDLVSLYKDRKDVMVIGVAMDYQDSKTVLKFADSLSISYPVVLGDRDTAAQIGGSISMLPTTFIFDPAGRPAAYRVGSISRKSLEEFMREHAANAPQPVGTAQRK